MPAIAAMMAPPVVVLRMLPEDMFDMAKEVEVAPARVVSPTTVSAPLALRVPPTLRTLLIVEEPVTASAVVVAPTAVRPPEKAICVVVALEGNG